jgi:hypothetical protein
MVDEEEVEKSFCLLRSHGWVVNRKMKKIILLEFKRTSDAEEDYFQDMWKVSEKQHTPILTGFRTLTEVGHAIDKKMLSTINKILIDFQLLITECL